VFVPLRANTVLEMPPIEDSDLIHTAILWRATGVDAYGKATVAAPVQVDCRWMPKRTAGTGDDGQKIAIDAQVIVDTDVPVDSIMMRGCLADYNGSAADNQYMKVASGQEASDLRGMYVRRQLNLTRQGAALPAVTPP